jgi:hypothetical protein
VRPIQQQATTSRLRRFSSADSCPMVAGRVPSSTPAWRTHSRSAFLPRYPELGGADGRDDVGRAAGDDPDPRVRVMYEDAVERTRQRIAE